MFYYVYLIRSIHSPDIVYVGYTINLKQRLETHNSGGSMYSFSMDCSGPSIQDVDHAWFLTKLVEYKRAYVQRQKHDEVVARLQEKYHSRDRVIARKVGIISGCYSPRAKL